MSEPAEVHEPVPPAPSEATTPAPESPPPIAREPEEDWATRYRYLLAEFDNFRKRTERERDQLRRENRALMLRQLLPFHDAFERAVVAANTRPSDDPLRRGLELLHREWERFLSGEEFAAVARRGERFRPSEEDAVGEVPATPEVPAGYVAEVVQQGYRCTGGLLRPAKVLVARPPAATDSDKPLARVPDAGPPVTEE